MNNQPFNKPRPNNKMGWKQGYYVPTNPQKFVGILDKIGVVYRSSLELKFMKMLDLNIDVLKWTYEHHQMAIPYYDPIMGKNRTYNPDFWMEAKTSKGIQIFLIEVKPESETVYPDRNRFKTTEAYKRQLTINALVEIKRRAASEFCKKKGWKYLFVTEKFFEKK